MMLLKPSKSQVWPLPLRTPHWPKKHNNLAGPGLSHKKKAASQFHAGFKPAPRRMLRTAGGAGFAFQRRKKQAAEKRGFQPSRVNGPQRLRTDPKSPKRRGPKSKKYPGGRPPKRTGIVALARLLSLMSTTHKELIII
ncbi:hypothetical protein CIHG_10435 [Coccidioides immitis H538.4]|uniref:Uncharacterized protein n=3 Tax=Coccidioides immitis TaxID=5501 RepID=A0A0J8QXZ9_COCIT|nr:hypothetical protein CIRG_01536 [Coccidioides immitis RMSCC 2394]KMU77341.1 hypothetical protein CISG_06382 [Coccidioides immitis RMSCC 3703]KMU92600.1 hypothetical protein CIHG_10435 [Coccidioides immitis H538.4]